MAKIGTIIPFFIISYCMSIFPLIILLTRRSRIEADLSIRQIMQDKKILSCISFNLEFTNISSLLNALIAVYFECFPEIPDNGHPVSGIRLLNLPKTLCKS